MDKDIDMVTHMRSYKLKVHTIMYHLAAGPDMLLRSAQPQARAMAEPGPRQDALHRYAR